MPYYGAKSSLQGSLVGLLGRSAPRGARRTQGTQGRWNLRPNSSLLDTGHSTAQTRAGLSLHCIPAATSGNMTCGTSLPLGPTRMGALRGSAHSPESQPEHADHTALRELLSTKASAIWVTSPRELGGGGNLYVTPLLSCLAGGSTSLSPAHRHQHPHHLIPCPSAQLSRDENGGSLMSHMPFSGVVFLLPQPRIS